MAPARRTPCVLKWNDLLTKLIVKKRTDQDHSGRNLDVWYKLIACVSWLLVVAGVGVCFAGGGGGALTNVYTGLIIHTDSPPPSYTYTTLPPHHTHLYTIYTSDPGLPARSAMAEMKYQTPGCEGRGYQLDMGTKLLKVTCHMPPFKTSGLGRWYQILADLSYISKNASDLTVKYLNACEN